MKELSIEEKAKAYDEALRIAKSMYQSNETEIGIKDYIASIFPELKESEDEETRKALKEYFINSFQNNGVAAICGVHIKDILAWLEKQGKNNMDISEATKQKLEDNLNNALEKETPESWNKFLDEQGEQKPFDYENATIVQQDFATQAEAEPKILGIGVEHSSGVLKECIDKIEQKSTDKVEPKFRVGDWIVQENIGVYKVIEVCESWYEVVDNKDKHYSISFDKEYMCRLWTIQDAKDGDILHSTEWHNDCIFIFNGLDNWKFDEPDGDRAVATGYCCLFVSAVKMEFGIQGPDCIEVNTVKPATKEQRDLLFQKMKEAGYEWDGEKKELKKIENESENYKQQAMSEMTDLVKDYIRQKPSIKLELDENGEPVLTPFEAELFSMMSEAWQQYVLGKEINIAEIVKEHSADLAALAHNQQPIMWSEEDEEIRQTIINEFEQSSEWYCSNGLTKEDCINWLNRQKYFKWSDEDNENMNSLCVLLDQMVSINAIGNEHSIEYKNWLNSLKDRVQPQPEWSEDIQQWIDTIIKDYEDLYDADKNHRATIQSKIDILKSLRGRYTWKPAEEQINVLQCECADKR